MEKFSPYASNLEEFITSLKPDHEKDQEIWNILNGQPSKVLRETISINQIKSSGAFFTNSTLTKFALEKFSSTFDKKTVIFDPACGSGNLLLFCASKFPTEESLSKTLANWGDRILGLDIFPEFISVTKSRLTLLAMTISQLQPININKLFPYIRVGSGLNEKTLFTQATHIVINPPFTLVDSQNQYPWANGKVNSAAIFLEKCVKSAKPRTRILAILPDVLRSGTRYKKWRRIINDHSKITNLDIYGRFNKWADVDVFITELEVHENNQEINNWLGISEFEGERIEDYFKVSIGPVVNYRDPSKGNWFPFIKSKGLPNWETLTSFPSKRRFSGKTITSPFVVIRRTSRKEDKHRAIGTIINSERSVAVENHLIILKPFDGNLITCKKLILILQHPETNRWLNQRIRCRHLTVSSVKEIPWLT